MANVVTDADIGGTDVEQVSEKDNNRVDMLLNLSGKLLQYERTLVLLMWSDNRYVIQNLSKVEQSNTMRVKFPS